MFRKFQICAQKNSEYRKKVNEFRNINKLEKDSDSDSETNLEIFASTSDFFLSTNSIMSEPNFQELRLLLDIIPNFSGNKCELQNFVSACNETLAYYPQASEPLKKILFRGILNKLRGKALTLISSRADLDTWDKVKEALRSAFADQRSFTCLLYELHSLKRGMKESPFDFGLRCQYIRSLIYSSISSDSTLSAEEKKAQNSSTEQLVLMTFFKYLPPQIQPIVRMKNPKTLEDAMTYLTEEENFLSITSDVRRVSTPNWLSHSSNNNKFSNTPQNNNHSPQPSTSRHPTQAHRQPFPSQPVPINSRRIPQHFSSSQQTFGKPPNVNVWQPKNQTPTYTPTPMSTVSKQTSTNRNFVQAQPQSIFHTEEPYDSEDVYTNHYDYANSNPEYYTETNLEYINYNEEQNDPEQSQVIEPAYNHAYSENKFTPSENFHAPASGTDHT